MVLVYNGAAAHDLSTLRRGFNKPWRCLFLPEMRQEIVRLIRQLEVDMIVKLTCCLLLVGVGLSYGWLTYTNTAYPEMPAQLLAICSALLGVAAGKEFIPKK